MSRFGDWERTSGLVGLKAVELAVKGFGLGLGLERAWERGVVEG